MFLKTSKILALALVLAAAIAVKANAADLALLRNGYEIRHEARESVGANTRLYLNADRTGGYVDVKSDQIVGFEKDESIGATPISSSAKPDSKASKPADIQGAVVAASKSHFIDPDLISSVIHAESSFKVDAVSPKGAQGLMQLMPGTASKLGVKDSFDPEANVDGGTRYLRELLIRYNDDLQKALAAYNAGPGRVDQYKGVPPYRETRQYVARIIRDFNRKKLATAANSRNATFSKARTARPAPAKAVPGPNTSSGVAGK